MLDVCVVEARNNSRLAVNSKPPFHPRPRNHHGSGVPWPRTALRLRRVLLVHGQACFEERRFRGAGSGNTLNQRKFDESSTISYMTTRLTKSTNSYEKSFILVPCQLTKVAKPSNVTAAWVSNPGSPSRRRRHSLWQTSHSALYRRQTPQLAGPQQ